MEEARQRLKRRRRDWAGIIEAQSKSGQTAGIYCREHDIPYKLFLYHRRKTQRGRSASSFIPMCASPAPHVVLRLSSGVVLESDRLPEVSWLIELARKLPGGGKATC